MKITTIRYYDGAKDKVCRLGLSHLFLELQDAIFDTHIALLEEKQANGAAYIREALDKSLGKKEGWEDTSSGGGIDWFKKFKFNQSIISKIGVEVQVSARSDMIIRDMVHIRNNLQAGNIDVGVVIVPSEKMQYYLPGRTPSFRDAVRYIEEDFKEARDFPIIVIAIEHDEPGEPLPKRKRRS